MYRAIARGMPQARSVPNRGAGVCPARGGVGLRDPLKNFVYFWKAFLESVLVGSTVLKNFVYSWKAFFFHSYLSHLPSKYVYSLLSEKILYILGSIFSWNPILPPLFFQSYNTSICIFLESIFF